VVFERLTDRAREALACGRLVAQQCGHRRIEPAHLLVGVLRNRDTTGCQALNEAGLRYIEVMTEVEEMYERAEDQPQAPPLLSVQAKRLLEDALGEAVAAGQRFAGTAHLALAFSRADAGSPVGALVAGREQAIRVAVHIAVGRSAQVEAELRARRRQAPPYRSRAARADALQRANMTRTQRAQLKRDLKSGRESIHDVLLTPPGFLQAAKVFDILLAVPSYGRTRVSSVLTRCRISPSKTIGGLSERQRDALLDVLR
jgi:ATP-dependent Clp protease ATP-binding subunit ClpA